MREIKFRVFGKENEIMIDWNELLEAEDLIEMLVHGHEEDGYYSPLMQYTGIDSDDGLNIFEGDIVKQEETLFGVVDTDLEFTGVIKMLEGCWVIDSGKDAVYLWSETACHQILGNIYEHPHLLEDNQ